MTSLTASPHSHSISFQEFRDFLLLLPRRVSTKEIYRFYEVRKFLGDDGRGAARVTMEGTLFRIAPRGRPYSLRFFTPAPYAGDVSLSAEDKPPSHLIYRPPAVQLPSVPSMHHDTIPNDADDGDDDDDDDDLLQEHHHMDEHHNWLGGTTALKFLAAGGVAGAGQRFFCTYSPQHVSLKCPLDREQCREHPQLRLTV